MLKWQRRDYHLAGGDGGPLGKKQSHVAGDVEGSRQPAPRADIELPSSLDGHLFDCRDGVLEAFRVQGGAIADCSEVGQVEDMRAKVRDRSRRQENAPVPEIGLPVEQQRERQHPTHAEDVAVRNLREGRHDLEAHGRSGRSHTLLSNGAS
jgi:hypothetical protein